MEVLNNADVADRCMGYGFCLGFGGFVWGGFLITSSDLRKDCFLEAT